MLNEGFILLHRSMLQWEWYGDEGAAREIIHLLLPAKYRPQHWCGLKIRRGQRVASVAKLAGELNMTPKRVRLALQRLTQSGEIACEPHARYTLYTVQKYGLYQGRWGKVEDKAQTAAPGRFPAMPQAAQGKLGAGRGQQWNKVQIIHTHAIHACVKKAAQAACTPPPPPRRGGEEKAGAARPAAGWSV